MAANTNKEKSPREEAKDKLEGFLKNPGGFSILILGQRGTGKTHWIKKLQEDNKENPLLGGLVPINGAFARNKNEEFWSEKFNEVNGKLLLIEDVEQLSKECQAILFEGLSTDNEGNLGLNKKNLKFRIAFTSSLDIKYLRDIEEYLSHKFFDRIAQLIVQFPSFADSDISIWKDFLATWDKMKFDKEKTPGKDLKEWLEKNSEKLHGNFRDLDKIAINWHNCILTGINRDDILKIVTKDFKELFHTPDHRLDLPDAFRINPDSDFHGNLENFRKKYKEWIKNEFGSLRKGEERAKVSYRTMERW